MKKRYGLILLLVCLLLVFASFQTGCKKNVSQGQPSNNPPLDEPITKPPLEEVKTPPVAEVTPPVNVENQVKAEIPPGLYPKEERQSAPEFDLPKLDGSGNLTLTSLKGKMILIDFTTTWCIWCTRQEPQVEDLYETYKEKGFTVIAIDCREPKDTVLGKYPGGKSMYPVLLDEDGNVSGNLYGVQGYPFYLLIDKEGKVAYVQSGFKEDMFNSVSKILDYLLEKER